MLVGILLLVAALLYVLAPLLWPRTPAWQVRDAAAGAPSLERLRDELYAAIVDLDFDHAVGKTDDEEYQQERADLKRQALAVLRLLDEQATDVEEAVEREVSAVRAVRTARERHIPAVPEAGMVDINEVAVAATPCAECGRVRDPDDRFCSGCGRPLAPAVVGAPAEADDDAIAEEIERQVGALRAERARVAAAVEAAEAAAGLAGARARDGSGDG